MEKKTRKPAWWQLYLLIPVMALLLGAAQISPLPGLSKEVTDLLIIVFVFGSMGIWAWMNRTELDEDYADRYALDEEFKVTVYEPLSQQEKNRELSHGAPPLAWAGTNKTQQDVEIEEIGSEK